MTKEKNNIEIKITQEKRVIEIPQYQSSVFISLMKNIKRYCKYLKLPLPIVNDLPNKTYFVIQRIVPGGQAYFVTQTMSDNYDEVKKYKNTHPRSNLNIVSQDVSVKEINIVKEIKPENEWEILGILDHEEGLIISAPNQQVPYNLVPSNLHDSSHCDHCHTKRFRNKTIFVQNKDTNEIKRVGGTCIRYYLGYDYEKILNIITQLNMFQNIFGDDGGGWADDDWFGGFGGRRYNAEDEIVDVKDIVKYFFYWVKNKGYSSKSATQKYNMKSTDGNLRRSTSEIVDQYLRYIYVPPLPGSSSDAKEAQSRWAKDIKEYNNIIKKSSGKYFKIIKKFIEERYKENNFLLNSRNFFNSGGVKIKHIKYIVSACSMYWGLNLSKESKNQDTKNSKYIGDIGKKEKLENLIIKNVSGFEGEYGWTNIYRLLDENGNVYTKFGTINKRFIVKDSPIKNIEPGAIVSFTAEIKKHDTFRDTKQTIIGRLSKI